MLQVDQLAISKGLILAGYYLANENINDLRYLISLSLYIALIYFIDSFLCFLCSTDRPAHRIADKIADNFNSALLVVVSLL